MNSANSQRRTVIVMVGATVGILGLLVGGITGWLRGRLREQVLEREAEAIQAVALMEIRSDALRTPGLVKTTQSMFMAVLESSRLRGVIAVQLFDPTGKLVAALPDLGDTMQKTPWWPRSLERPAVRFLPRASLEAIFTVSVDPGEEPTLVPVLETVIPLKVDFQSLSSIGTARYWIDGERVATEFARMDRGLIWQAGFAYVGASLLVLLVFGWASKRLAEANRRLSEQSNDLARANQELDFSAKIGAIGAISAHLIHGLKNPLAGLEDFVSAPEPEGLAQRGEAWREARDTTRRLRALVQEVTSVLREEETGQADYPVPVAEMVAQVMAKAQFAAETAGVKLVAEISQETQVTARTANLASLILANLLTNAFEASPRGSKVILIARSTEKSVEFLVQDRGNGIPAAKIAALFRPIRSTKRNGGGVGLAISHQLARYLGGSLELKHSDPNGSVFCLRVPPAQGSGQSNAPTFMYPHIR